jgi:uncharacterized C2H2 Zn-finger protein
MDASERCKEGAKSSARIDNWVCDVCDKGFPKKSMLERHKAVHSDEKPYSCSECGKSFNQKSAMQLHAGIHSTVRPFQCPMCGTGFSQRGNLRKHVKRLHPQSVNLDVAVPCPHCQCIFTDTKSLRVHITKYHSAVKQDGNNISDTAVTTRTLCSTRRKASKALSQQDFQSGCTGQSRQELSSATTGKHINKAMSDVVNTSFAIGSNQQATDVTPSCLPHNSHQNHSQGAVYVAAPTGVLALNTVAVSGTALCCEVPSSVLDQSQPLQRIPAAAANAGCNGTDLGDCFNLTSFSDAQFGQPMLATGSQCATRNPPLVPTSGNAVTSFGMSAGTVTSEAGVGIVVENDQRLSTAFQRALKPSGAIKRKFKQVKTVPVPNVPVSTGSESFPKSLPPDAASIVPSTEQVGSSLFPSQICSAEPGRKLSGKRVIEGSSGLARSTERIIVAGPGKQDVSDNAGFVVPCDSFGLTSGIFSCTFPIRFNLHERN